MKILRGFRVANSVVWMLTTGTVVVAVLLSEVSMASADASQYRISGPAAVLL